ncbi:MAG: sulfatase [Acidobacteria bacterium]|nr:sulfatase [Acidobacteriota bacterium]
MRPALAFFLLTVCIAAAREPNLIIIYADDQGWGDLSSYGNPYIRTPRIDRMAAEGIRFTDFYAQPFCGPSRAALMTGTYPPRNSMMFNHLPRAKTGIHANEVTLAELLKTRGYATMIVGKWHLGDAPPFLPTRHGFDKWFGLPYSNDMWPFHPKTEKHEHEDPRLTEIRKRAEMTGYQGQGDIYPRNWFPDLPLMRDNDVVELNPDQTELTKRYNQEALGFITANREKPFFLYLAHSMPHVPLHPSKEFAGRSLRGKYGDVIEEIDSGVGRLLDHVKSLGLDQNTLIVFTSDNGPWLHYGIDAGSAGPLRDGKGTLWEGGVRVPAVFRWPGKIPAGRVTSEIAANIDIYSTFAALAGAALPKDRTIDSLNLWPFLSGQAAKSPRESFFYYSGEVFYKAEDGRPKHSSKLEAVREKRWKLWLTTGALYDLQEDIGEKRDVAKFHPDIAARLRKMAEAFDASLQRNVRPLGELPAQ